MRLGQKNLLYSMVLAGVMMLFLIGYFICMLPSLYVDHVAEQNLKSAYEQHMAYMKNGSYQDVGVKNTTACFSLEIPMEGNLILVTGKAFSAEIKVRDQRLLELLDRCREKLENSGLSAGKTEDTGRDGRGTVIAGGEAPGFGLTEEMEELGEILKASVEKDSALPVEIRLLYRGRAEEDFFNESLRIHSYSGGPVIFEFGIEDIYNRYTNYVAVEETENSMVFSVLPIVAPNVNEIRPVVLGSLPMLGAVIRESYRELEEKNQELKEENRRQEVFLRASSHQLKTPVAAALLLVEGMINDIGRYRDTKVYLPKVKEQLLSMRSMVEDILYLNHCGQDGRLLQVDVGRLLEERLRSCQVELTEKGISAEFCGQKDLVVCTDETMIVQILDNLLSNAVKYTPREGSVRILPEACNREGKPGIRIENSGVTIPRELLPHVFEPFVSGSHEKNAASDSHGLGLYIASYYAKKLGITLRVENGDNCVVASVVFPQET